MGNMGHLWLSPAFDDDLLFCVELDGVASLGVQVAEEAGFPSAEGEISDWSGHADVDADVARRSLVLEAASGGSVGGEQRGCVAVFAQADNANGFFQCVGMHETEHGAKDLGGRKLTRWRNSVNYRGTNEIAGLVARDLRAAAIVRDGCSVSSALGDKAFDAGAAVGRNDRPHADTLVESVAHLDGTGGVADGVA